MVGFEPVAKAKNPMMGTQQGPGNTQRNPSALVCPCELVLHQRK